MKKHEKLNIIITGSSSGIGQSLRERYERRGDKVIGISIDNDDYCVDVSNKAQLKEAIDDIKEKNQKIDMIINCAGFGLSGAIELIDEKQVEKTVSHQTNPIAKKFIEFHKENLSKLSVKDLFKR